MSLIKVIVLFFALLCLTACSKIPSKETKYINVWNPELIKNSTNYQTGLVDPEQYLENDSEIKNQIYSLIDDIKRLKDVDVTLIYISSMSDEYMKDSIKDITKFVDDLSAIIVGRNMESDARSIIILFAVTDKQMQIRTGKDVKNIISNSLAASLLKTVKTQLRMKYYAKAGQIILDKILNRLTGTGEANLTLASKLFASLIFFGSICCCLNCFQACSKQLSICENNSDSEAESKLQKIQEITKRNKNKKDFVEKSCVVCLEDLPTVERKDNGTTDIPKSKNCPQNKNADEDENKTTNQDNKEIKEEATSTNPPSPNQINLDIAKNNQIKEEDEDKPLINENYFKALEKDCNIAKLDCGHSFHLSCITQWYEKQNKCPVCRSLIDGEDKSKSEKPLEQGLVEIQTEMHPSLSSYAFVFGNVFSWNSPTFNYVSNNNDRTSSNTFEAGGFFEGGWNDAGGAFDGW